MASIAWVDMYKQHVACCCQDFGEKFKPSDETIASARKSVADIAEAARTSVR